MKMSLFVAVVALVSNGGNLKSDLNSQQLKKPEDES